MMKPVDEMTHEEVRGEIAAILGESCHVTWPYGSEGDVRVAIPNWPENLYSAMKLCKKLAKSHCCELELDWGSGPDCRATFRQNGVFFYGAVGGSTELALSRLALAVLRLAR